MFLMLHSYLRSRSQHEWMWRVALYGGQECQTIALRNRNDTYQRVGAMRVANGFGEVTGR